MATKRIITLTRQAGFEDFGKLHPQGDTVPEVHITGATQAHESASASRSRRRSDTVAAAASEALRFYVKRGPPPQGSASVGMQLARDESESMVVKAVQVNSPAAESGQVFVGNVVHFIEDDDLEGLSPADAELYLYGAEESCVNVTLSDGGSSATRGNLRVVPLQRQLADEDGEFAAPADAAGGAAWGGEGSGVDGCVVRLMLDGNFESLLEGDQAAQQVYGWLIGHAQVRAHRAAQCC